MARGAAQPDFATRAEKFQAVDNETLQTDLNTALLNADAQDALRLVGEISRRTGIGRIAKLTGLSRVGLYRLFQTDRDLRLGVALKLLQSSGLTLVAAPLPNARQDNSL